MTGENISWSYQSKGIGLLAYIKVNIFIKFEYICLASDYLLTYNSDNKAHLIASQINNLLYTSENVKYDI